MKTQITEINGEDEYGKYTEVSAVIDGEKIGKVIHHTGDTIRDKQAIEREHDVIFCTISYFEGLKGGGQ
jgi:hypothetical protein